VRFLAPLAFAFLLGWLGSSLGLSGTIGGFAAGLILSDEALRDKTKEMLVPLIAVFTPIFFLLIGMQVNLAVFLQWHTLLLTAALLLVAVLGKLPSALAAGRGLDRPTVAIGMLPRGEVALIFVGVGRSLNIIDDQLFAALVAVIILLAFGSALALKWVFPPRSPGVEAWLGRLSRRLAR
jgi:Kef-type K+ transport system membrane component KefB